VAAIHASAIVYQFALNPQRNLENRESKYVESVPSRGPPPALGPPEDPIPNAGMAVIDAKVRAVLSEIGFS
jgi:hypothetical protein